tara:strand:+ start:5275 stop:6273 length:999 start_codon:yes stop_codon:yes gene_type:complete
MKLNINYLLPLIILIIFNINSNVNAQNNNNIIINKLESLERDIRDIQRKIYQSKEKNENNTLTNESNNNQSVTSKGLANHELRLIEIEEQYRKTNGLTEELSFKIKKLEEENSLLKKSIDDLINKLETTKQLIENSNKNQILSKNINASGMDNDIANDEESSNVGVLARINPDGTDQIIKKNENSNSLEDINITEKKQEKIINSKNPEEIYQRAYNMLSKGEYEAAEVAFTSFIKDYPENKLSSNAYYWLGETFYVRKNYQLAAYNFAAGYKKFPLGSKAADQLLKLGISLYSLEKSSESCATFKKLIKEFPEMPPRILNRANSFQERLECK